MEISQKTQITVQEAIAAPISKVWEFYTLPKHIINWNAASDAWHTPRAENDLQPGGSFVSRMEAKDGSMGFDFGGVYQDVKKYELISYIMEDGRKAKITFAEEGDKTEVKVTFDAEETNSEEMQRGGWQAILTNFKSYTESHV